jgi:uncharacterized protein YcbX
MSILPAAGSLASLHRYPVKSMMGEELNAARMTARGLFGDRGYALCDIESRKIASAKNPRKWPGLFRYHAAFEVPPPLAPEESGHLPAVRVTLPDGSYISSTHGDFAAVVSRSLGRDVQLLSVPPADARLEEYWPDMEGLAHRDAVTDEKVPAGTFFDLAPIHILTTSTLDALREFYPQGRFEPRRFRPNLIVDTTGQEGFVENNWVGKTLAIGPEVKIQVTMPCGRCVMTTLAQGDLPKDPGILKTAAKHNNICIGAYATVVQVGTLRAGDAVRIV